ncbi:hypothetical protein FA046_07365 [Pedobacter cryophilus]|uniref:Uncharacterized protein n=2 Tax=Pedobacter cryophilus TaxID=2571271 RepID=A0A4U1C3M7_9SPHI|nr:hypothetical protein FA046_07365 [Pedobacter cryophilus]
MFISTAPVFFDLDQKVVNAAIMQLELEIEAKENNADTKNVNNFLKKGIDFINNQNFSVNTVLKIDDIDYHFVSKKYIKTYFPRVLTPPPNHI